MFCFAIYLLFVANILDHNIKQTNEIPQYLLQPPTINDVNLYIKDHDKYKNVNKHLFLSSKSEITKLENEIKTELESCNPDQSHYGNAKQQTFYLLISGYMSYLESLKIDESILYPSKTIASDPYVQKYYKEVVTKYIAKKSNGVKSVDYVNEALENDNTVKEILEQDDTEKKNKDILYYMCMSNAFIYLKLLKQYREGKETFENIKILHNRYIVGCFLYVQSCSDIDKYTILTQLATFLVEKIKNNIV
ncbi:hypothetical protein BDAP_000236 [Binucleata daphniae]